METASDLAKTAAGNFMSADPVLGSVVVILALAFIVVVVVGWRRDGAKDAVIAGLNKELLQQERAFRVEISSLDGKLDTRLEKLENLISFVSAKGK